MKIKKLIMVILLISLLLSACDPSDSGAEVPPSNPIYMFFKIIGTILHDGYEKWIARGGVDETLKNNEDQHGYITDPPEPILPIDPAAPNSGTSAPISNLPLKPVGFVNYGTINAIVKPWIYIPLGSSQPQTPPGGSIVSTVQGSGGDWPNSSRFISLPLGTYSWCIEWQEDDQDGDGYFDSYHYFEEGLTVVDENASDELEFAVEVAISAPPANAPIYEGKCGETNTDESDGTYIGYIENVEFKLVIDFITGSVSGTIHFDDAEIYGENGWYWGDAAIDGSLDLATYTLIADWTGNCGSHYHGITEPWSGTIEGFVNDDLESFSGTCFDDDGTTQNFTAARQ